jgi:ATP-dependent DNA ligase
LDFLRSFRRIVSPARPGHGSFRYRRQDHAVTLCAFDLLELDGEDLRREPIEVRKRTLKGLLRRAHPGIAFNRHFDAEGEVAFKQACALGCEGIVSKRLGSPYRAGRADCWVKVKNPAASAVKREAEETRRSLPVVALIQHWVDEQTGTRTNKQNETSRDLTVSACSSALYLT